MRRAESAQREEDSPATPGDPMLDGFLGRAMHWRLHALRLLDHFTDDRLKLEQVHLRLRKFFSARTILLNPHQPRNPGLD